MSGVSAPIDGFLANPYYLGDAPISQAKRFSHEYHDIFLVSRLDGFNQDDLHELIDRGSAPVSRGGILLDQRESRPEDKGNAWLAAAADWMRTNQAADRMILESTAGILENRRNVLGYYSWGSNDPAIRTRDLDLGFVPGAIGGMFVSSDCRTFKEPPPDWQVGLWDGSIPEFEGSPQSLAGDLIREGITGVAGYVAEPYLEASVRPQILFPAYLSGFNLIESFYLAMPYLSWQTVVVGDPLCAPFRAEHLTAQESDPGVNAETELPTWFSARRVKATALQAFKRSGIQPSVTKMLLRAGVRLAKGDRVTARRILEEATSTVGRLPAAQLTLAGIYEGEGEYEKAIERYRVVTELIPDNLMALNNLAYALAERKNNPNEALPYAERAYGLAGENPNISDTLGWIHHLLGNQEKAKELLEDAMERAPDNAAIRIHMAVVYGETGDLEAAKRELERALQLDPGLTENPHVKELRRKISKP